MSQTDASEQLQTSLKEFDVHEESKHAVSGSSQMLPTSFEKVVQQLDLSPSDYASSMTLREWVSKNKDQKYVPPDLLEAFGFVVTTDV